MVICFSRPARGAKPSADEVAVVEAAYRLEGTETDWLAGLARTAAPLLDEGWGLAVSTSSVDHGLVRQRAIAAVGGATDFAEAVAYATQHCNMEIRRGLLRSAPCTSISRSGGLQLSDNDPAGERLLASGLRDCIAVLGVDSGRYCTTLTAYRPTPVRPTRQVVSRWSRIASHFAAGFRLRRGIAALRAHSPQAEAQATDGFEGSEAILTSAGKLQHAAGPAEHAQRSLAHAVLAMDRARGRQRSDDPDAALEAWKGLVAGRWSLIDHIDTDGKRFLVAHRNDPDNQPLRGLSARECQVLTSRARGFALKLIAYDLGLSIASVSKTLHSAMTKLGLSNEAQLAALFARPSALAADSTRPPAS